MILGYIALLKSTHVCSRSLNKNQLCGVDEYDGGTFSTEGITALCEGLKQSKVSSLRCVGQISE